MSAEVKLRMLEGSELQYKTELRAASYFVDVIVIWIRTYKFVPDDGD